MTALLRTAHGYLIADDGGSTYQALVAGRAVDAAGRPIAEVAVACPRAGTRTRTTSAGDFVVAGIVGIALPTLETAADSVPVRLSAPQRATLAMDVAVPQQATLPVLLGDVALPSPALTLRGQVRRRDLAQAPVPGAEVRVVPSPSVAHPLTLRVGLRASFPATTTTVRATTVVPAAAATTTAAAAAVGTHLLALASTAGIAAGTVLRCAPGTQEQYVRVRELVAGQVVLDQPLAASLPFGAEVGAVTVTPGGPTRQLTRDAPAGDRVLALDAELAGDTVRVTDGVSGDEEDHASGARSDPAGFYRLSGVRGFAVVAVHARAAGLASTQDPVEWRADERRGEATLDLFVQP